MSVQSQIDRLNAIKQRIRTNLVAQGITVPEDTMLEAMADQILFVAGEPGTDGINGTDGYTPVRGVDYWTPEDIAAIDADIATELAKRGQLKPEFAQTIEECTDTTKLYVLPDGYIYAYMYTEVEVGGYTNMVDTTDANFKTGYRLNANNAEASANVSGAFVSNYIPVKKGDIIRIKGVTEADGASGTQPRFKIAPFQADYASMVTNNSFLVKGTTATTADIGNAVTISDDGVYEWTVAVTNLGTHWDRAGTIETVRVCGVATDGIENVIVAVNEEIVEPETIKQYQWANTGHAFVPADYEDRIIALEAEDTEIREEIAAAKAETDGAIANLQEQIDSGAASAKSGARWFALGDSITEGWTSAVDETATSGYKQYINTNVAERWVNIVATKNGYELTNYGVGGTGYAHAKTGTGNARAQVANIDFSQCDFVTLAYGTNDWKGKATLGSMDDDVDTVDAFIPNMRYVIEKILTDNPYCKIFVITPINCRSLGTYSTNWGINYAGDAASGPGLEQIFQLQKAVCEEYGIELIDMTHCSIINRENIKTMLPDYVHPTVECHRMIARELATKIHFR